MYLTKQEVTKISLRMEFLSGTYKIIEAFTKYQYLN